MIVMALPLGVCAAIYMVEYAGDSRLARIIRASVNNLAGVPSDEVCRNRHSESHIETV